jgi:Oxidoreductase molybdopterin binding domain
VAPLDVLIEPFTSRTYAVATLVFSLEGLLLHHFLGRYSRRRRAFRGGPGWLPYWGVHETPADLAALQDLLDRSAAAAGASRRFTGSYEAGSFDPAAMPTTSWIDDVAPEVDPATWRLVVADADGERELSLQELSGHNARLRATLDCTSGWYAHQDWEGAPVAALVRNIGAARSLWVHSSTGYWIQFPIGDLERLLLATRVGGAPLSVGHGFPARLVAPGRRGFWWVKWVDRIELRSTSWWWQPPFPVT